MTASLSADTVALPRIAPPARRTPIAAWLLAWLSVGEALGLLTLGLVGVAGARSLADRPSGLVVGLVAVGLAAWVVVVAGAAATLLDGGGRRLVRAVATGELVLTGSLALLGAALVVPVGLGPWRELPAPALCLLAAVVPLSKLVLAGAPSVQDWVQAGGRVVRRRPVAPSLSPRQHRLQLVTVVAIGVALTGVALLAPAAPGTPGTTTSGAVSAP